MVRKPSCNTEPNARPLDNCQVGETAFQINDFTRSLSDTAALKERTYFLFFFTIKMFLRIRDIISRYL